MFNKDGDRMDYTHVTNITAAEKMIYIEGETEDVAGGRINVKEHLSISNIHAMIVEFYVPRE
jgi:hypothetical protein